MNCTNLTKSFKAELDKSRFFIFLGNEWHVQNVLLSYAEKQGFEKTVVESVSKAQSLLKGSLRRSKRLFIIREDIEYIKNEKGCKTIVDALKTKSDAVVLIYREYDKRSKFYKQNKDFVYEFDGLTRSSCATQIRKLAELYEQDSELLADICGCDLGRAATELNKLKHLRENFAKENVRKTISNLFRESVESDLILSELPDITFDFVNAIASRNVKRLSELRELAFDAEEPAIKTLSILYTTFRQILGVQESKNFAKEMNPWQFKKIKMLTGIFDESELIHYMTLIDKTICNIKSGIMDEDVAVDYVIVKIFGRC